MVASAAICGRDFNASIIYVDYNSYELDIRRPIPGTVKMDIVYSPTRDIPELFHS